MKIFILVAAACIASCYAKGLTEEDKANFKKYKDECVAETGADGDLVDVAANNAYVNRDKKIDCYFSCFLKKVDIRQPDGTINNDKAVEMSKKWETDEKALEIVNKCKIHLKDIKSADDDHCDMAGNYMVCIYQNKSSK